MWPPLVSFITPTYNESKNLEKNIKNIQENMKNYFFEIIIVDDNSPDGCGKIADKYAKTYSNIKVLHRRGKEGPRAAPRDRSRAGR